MNSTTPEGSGATAPAAPPHQPVAAPAAPLGRQAKLVLAVLAACALAALFWPRNEGAAPGGFLLDANGRPQPIGRRMAPVTLVHFWATWCPPCIEEIPALERLSAAFAGHPEFGLLMVAVSDSTDKVSSFLGPSADMVLYDPQWDVARRYGTDKLPETYLVVRGKVLEKFVGQTNWDDPALRRRIQAHLGEEVGEGAGGAGG